MMARVGVRMREDGEKQREERRDRRKKLGE